jgi:group I intron endonuclease
MFPFYYLGVQIKEEIKMGKLCGIYIIENLINGDFYVGQSIDIRHRTNYHMRTLKKGNHYNFHLQRAVNKYGANNFKPKILLLCEKDQLTYYEQEIVNIMNPVYNICKECVDTCKGISPSEETRKKMSKNHADFRGENSVWKGRHHTEESKEKIREKRKLYIVSDDARKKMSKSRKGRKHTEKSKLLMSENQKGEKNSFYNKKHTDETIQKIVSKNIGVKKRFDTSSKYVGVSRRKESGKWRAIIVYKKKSIEIGRYDTEKEAAIAYNTKAIELYGKNAKLNIIEDKEE